MAGQKGLSGRRRATGILYRLSFRFEPGVDPPELRVLLESVKEAKGRKRRDIMRIALLGGLQQAYAVAAAAEDSETAGLIDGMFEDF